MNRVLLNFDLSQQLLKEHYPNPNYKYAYTQIGMFLKRNGFDHHQGSGYISKNPMRLSRVNGILWNLQIKYPWIIKCVEVFSITKVVEQSLDAKVIFARAAEKQSLQQAEKKKDKHFSR